MPDNNTSAYREFFELQGFRSVQTENTFWVELCRGVFQPTPAYRFQPEQAQESSRALRQGRGLLARWFTPVNASSDSPDTSRLGRTPIYLLRPPYDINRIGSNARSHTRRGLKRVEVRKVEFDASLERQAFPVYADNIGRLGLLKRGNGLNRRWAQWVNSLSHSRCTEFWGAWEADRLVAFSVVLFSPWGAEIVCSRSLTAALNLYPNNALVFHIATSVFERGIEVLSYGLGEFGAAAGGLDHFKKGMGFEEVPLEEHFCWHPALCFLNPVLNSDRIHGAGRFIKWLKRASVGRAGTRPAKTGSNVAATALQETGI